MPTNWPGLNASYIVTLTQNLRSPHAMEQCNDGHWGLVWMCSDTPVPVVVFCTREMCWPQFHLHLMDLVFLFLPPKCTAQRTSFWRTLQVWSWVRATQEAIPSSRPALGWWECNPTTTSPSQWSTFSVRSSMMSLRSLMVSQSNVEQLPAAEGRFASEL